MAFIGHIGF